MFGCVLNAIKQYQRKLNVTFTECIEPMVSKTWLCISKGTKEVQSVLVCTEAVPAATLKWSNAYENLNWNLIFSHCFKTTGSA